MLTHTMERERRESYIHMTHMHTQERDMQKDNTTESERSSLERAMYT